MDPEMNIEKAVQAQLKKAFSGDNASKSEVLEIFKTLVETIINNKEDVEKSLSLIENEISRVSESAQLTQGDVNEIRGQLNEVIRKIKEVRALKGDKGDKGEQGEPGLPGIDGKDGNIKDLSPQEVRDSLELLEGDERLDVTAIKGVDERLNEIKSNVDVLARIPRGGGGGNVEVYSEGTKIGSSQRLNFVGATVTSDGGEVKINITDATSDVNGPASSTDNAIARWDGTTGKLIQNTSNVTIDDDGNITLPSQINFNSAVYTQFQATQAGVNLEFQTKATDGGSILFKPRTVETLKVDATGVVINEGGTSTQDFRVEGDTEANLLFIDASADKIGIGEAAPVALLDITSGNDAAGLGGSDIALAYYDGGFRHWISTNHNAAASSNSIDFYVNSSGTAGGSSAPGTGNVHNLTLKDGSVGIGTTNPTNGKLEVSQNSGTTAAYISQAGSGGTVTIVSSSTTSNALQSTGKYAGRFNSNVASGHALEVAVNANSTGISIDNNDNGRSINIDHDGNSASAITGLWVNTANAGAGAAYAAIFEAGRVGIGNTSPASILDVREATSAGRTNIDFTNTAAVNTANRLRLRLGAFTGFVGSDLHPYLESIVEDAGTGKTGLGLGTYDGSALNEIVRISGAGNVGIGISSPNANAILDVSSTTKAFMPPRMTTTQKNNIASPTAGMVVYDNVLNKLCVYTTTWETITSA